MRVRSKLVDRTAEDVLSRFPEVVGPPVDLDDLAKKLDVTLFERALDSGIDGLSAVEDGQRSIIVDESSSLMRKRFTIAHELGHLLLHSDSPINVTREEVLFFRNEDSAKGELWREIEANRFAANLLMPASLVRDFLKSFSHSGLTSSSLEVLANKFGVSREAMAFRLGNLGYTS